MSCRYNFEKMLDHPEILPVRFSFYSEEFYWKTFRGFSEENFVTESRKITQGNDVVQADYTFRMKKTNLKIDLIIRYYPSFGAIDWQYSFENDGKEDTGVINEIVPLDFIVEAEHPVLKGILGDHKNKYRPYEADLNKYPVTFRCLNGRSTHEVFPYFNLECDLGGVLMALGWGGTWEAEFSCEKEGVHVKALGNVGITTYLKPGEKINSALIVLVPYERRDEDYAMNIWRRWFLQHNTPKKNRNGETLAPFNLAYFACDTGRPNEDGSISEDYTTWKPTFQKMLQEGIKTDYRWVDAGWYTNSRGESVSTWREVGSWEMDASKWPGDSFLKMTEATSSKGIKTMLWFEPERLNEVDGLVENYGYKREWAIGDDGFDYFNNIGDPDCYRWTLDRILNVMKKNKIDFYREDNNFLDRFANPASKWQREDCKEGRFRVGITENKAVSAHYRLWEDICNHNEDNSFVDSCASGGGRNDIWSMRYAVAVCRSDADRTTIPLRISMTHSFSKWIPFNGAATNEKVGELDLESKHNIYAFRASYSPIQYLTVQWVQNPNEDFDIIRKGVEEWKSINRYLLKDFYTLTPWHDHLTDNTFDAFEYFDPEDDSGILLAFRNENCEEEEVTIKLKGLQDDKEYYMINVDTEEKQIFSGKELAAGFTVSAREKRSAVLIHIT